MILKIPSAPVRPSLSPQLSERLSPERVSDDRPANSRTVDLLELSDAAREATPAKPVIREELVQRLRESIASGQYLTTDRINGAVEGLHQELFGNR